VKDFFLIEWIFVSVFARFWPDCADWCNQRKRTLTV